MLLDNNTEKVIDLLNIYDDLNDSLIHKDFIGDSTFRKMLMYGKEASNRKQ